MCGVPIITTLTSICTGSGLIETPVTMFNGSKTWISTLRVRSVRFSAVQTPGSTSASIASTTRIPPWARNRLPALMRVWSVAQSPPPVRTASMVPNRLR